MAQVSMTVRMDAGLKAAFDDLCAQFGMSVNTAMTIFAKAVVRERAIPFEIKATNEDVCSRGINAFKAIRAQAENGQLPDLSLEEINEEIRLARLER